MSGRSDSYAQLTFADRNPVKRWLQRTRLAHALAMTERMDKPRVILDFGAGNGEMCKSLARRYPRARIVCYEPTADYMAEAKANLARVNGIEFVSSTNAIASGTVDLVCCLEVFEHLPPRETNNAFAEMRRVLSSTGNLIIGVPVEVGIPALYKGLFRMMRRYGAADAKPRDILASVLGTPPLERAEHTLQTGQRYYFTHMGFDHRRFRTSLAKTFDLRKISASPLPFLGTLFNPEVYFVSEKMPGDAVIVGAP